jgi:predicted nucleotide-binding protein
MGEAGSEVRQRSDRIFEFVIAPAVAAAGYSALRADQISAPGLITSQIIQHILTDPLAIADISGMNPNVMYELALRHAFNKPVIQVAVEGTRPPFDVSGLRTIIVNIGDLDSVQRAKTDIERAITHIEAPGYEVESPVTVVARLESLAETPTQIASLTAELDRPFFADILRNIEERLRTIEYRIAKAPTGIAERAKFSRRIFVVHGHDGELKTELARFLERLDFEPVILHEQPDKGQTIFAKLNAEMFDVGFAFIVLTPDDVGSARGSTNELRPRARQNVIFEHGLFTGYLRPNRVCAIRKGDVEVPSDLHGVIYKTVASGAGLRSIAIDLLYELRAAGYEVDANKL